MKRLRVVFLLAAAVLLSTAISSGTAYDPEAGNNTMPYAIVCGSAPGGGFTQNFGLSFVNITSGDIQTAYAGQAPAWGVAVSPDGRYVYLVNEMGSSISVMDAGNRTVIGTIPVGMYPQDAVVSPDGTRIYVSGAPAYGNTITVIKGPTGRVAATINTNISPGKMAISPDGSRLYVSQSFYDTSGASSDIEVVDIANDTVAGAIKAGGHPVSVAVSPDGSLLYAACLDTGIISSIDTATGMAVATAKTGRSPVDITLSKDGSTLYAVNDYFGRSFVSVINTSSMSIISKTDLPGHGVDDIQYSAIKRIVAANDGSAIYVTDHTLSAVYVVNATSGSIVKAVNPGNSPSGIALSSDGLLYVTSKGSGGLAIINASDVRDVAMVSYALSARYVSILPDGKKAYITNGDVGTVSVLDVDNMSIGSTIDAGGIMNKLAVSPDGRRVYVADTRNGRVLLVDTATDEVAGNWSLGLTPMDIATSPDGSIVYVTHSRKGADESYYDLSRIDAATGKVLSTYQLGKFASGLAVSPDGKKLYACLWASDTVLAMDSSTGRVISRITAKGSPEDVKVSPDGSLVYVACPNGAGISVYFVKGDTFIASIGESAHPSHMAITPDGATLCATGRGGIVLVDLKNWTVIKVLPVSDTLGVAINPAMGGMRT
jgi:YVTN family beta-propeller protein